MYDPDLDYYNKSWFLKFYSALGCINLPKREKYNPDYFTDIFSSSTTNNTTCSQHDNFQKQGTTDRGYMETEIVEETDLETITLDGDFSSDETEGEQECPLAMLIAWEFPEEQMPQFFYLGYNWSN